jgi:hypothetical protein
MRTLLSPRLFEEHEQSCRSETLQPLFNQVLELCENSNEEIAYRRLRSGSVYSMEQAAKARANATRKQRY